MSEGADRATAGYAGHTVNEERPRSGVLVEPQHVIHDLSGVILGHEDDP